MGPTAFAASYSRADGVRGHDTRHTDDDDVRDDDFDDDDGGGDSGNQGGGETDDDEDDERSARVRFISPIDDDARERRVSRVL